MTPRVVRLLDEGVPVKGPSGMVYSSAPLVCNAEDGARYVVKGPDIEAVAAETVAHSLAGLVELPVPDFALTDSSVGRRFGSRHIDGVRDVSSFLRNALEVVSKAIVFDVWLFNDDRNLGGFVMDPDAGLIAIDFEKSWAIRYRSPTIQLPLRNAKKLWPSNELGTFLRGLKVPVDFIKRIESVSDTEILAATGGASAGLVEFSWWKDTAHILKQRRLQLRNLVREVWP